MNIDQCGPKILEDAIVAMFLLGDNGHRLLQFAPELPPPSLLETPEPRQCG
jgi:hypothetical protein